MIIHIWFKEIVAVNDITAFFRTDDPYPLLFIPAWKCKCTRDKNPFNHASSGWRSDIWRNDAIWGYVLGSFTANLSLTSQWFPPRLNTVEGTQEGRKEREWYGVGGRLCRGDVVVSLIPLRLWLLFVLLLLLVPLYCLHHPHPHRHHHHHH